MVSSTFSQPQTLPELLHSRAQDSHSTAQIAFVNADGQVANHFSLAELYHDSIEYASRLLAVGLSSRDIVLASFPDHESHIRLFWACCLAGIPVCPLPAPHPDDSRQKLLLDHLQQLFHQPTLIAQAETIQAVRLLAPDLKTLEPEKLSEYVCDGSKMYPARIPAPTDAVCFMLTSGSTGNSKAVQLSHSNILSSVRGKIQHHNISSTSRFFNWIASDHVACLSEIHIHAIEANASQFHALPPSIIRNPRNLLTWASTLKITYTFSPNFLLAQILREVASSPFPASIDLSALRTLISGGEAVPLNTAVAFADLLEQFGARRDVLRAGFGMSETAAGCIYDTRPLPDVVAEGSSKYLSVGKCCLGISIRIVDQRAPAIPSGDREGQLQVKGPTVFTKYYGNDTATRRSFTEDGWFITGDVAKVDGEGNLHLVGRDKDRLNINGLKILPLDVQQYIEDSRIDGVMPGFVYVCPIRLEGADTESYAVFYQHVTFVENGVDRAERLGIRQANRAIKDACTLFCSQAPHVILPLPRSSFVKTTLGKISPSQLTTSYLRGDFSDLETHLDLEEDTPKEGLDQLRTPFERDFGKILSDIFSIDFSDLRRSQNVFDMGASSMHLMRLKQILQDQFGLRDLHTFELLKRPQIGQLSDYLCDLVSRKDMPKSVYQPLVCLNDAGTKPPLFLIHPGLGEVLVFVGLARTLDDDRPIYALRAPGFEIGDPKFGSVQEIATAYKSAIEECFPNGPYYLAGYSFGAAIAFEIGKTFEAEGKHVAFLGVLNLPPDIQFRMKELSWLEVLLNIGMFMSLYSSESMELLRAQLLKEFPHVATIDAAPPNPAEVVGWLLDKSDKTRLAELDLQMDALLRWIQVAYDMGCAGRSFEPRGCVNGALTTVFCAVPLPSMGTREEYKRDRLSRWKDFSGERFEMVDVDGEHYTLLGPVHVASFAGHLRRALARADAPLSSTVVTPAVTHTVPRKLDFDHVPIVDFALAKTDRMTYLGQFKYAFEDVGFGVFVNVPGFEASFQDDLFTQAEQLYYKPQTWKNQLGTSNSPALRGYFRADDVSGSHKAHAEAYRFGAEMPAPGALDDAAIPFWLKLHEGPNQWPPESELPEFRMKMETLFERYKELNHELNRHICQLLDIENQVLDDYFPEKTEFNSAIWHYFPITPERLQEARNGFVQGMHAHRDPSTFLTCLIQSRPGLQVQNHAGDWLDIPMVDGGVVCNVGVQLMKLTGGKFVATTHRVNTLKIDKDRFTIPYVLSTKLDKPVVPLSQFNSPDSAKAHVAPDSRIAKLMAIEDPLIRSGYARLTLFPAATKKLYPKEFEEATRMGIL